MTMQSMASIIAERDGDRQFICSVRDRAWAEQRIEFMERHGGWPEGYDAVYEMAGGGRYLYTGNGQWESA